MENIKWIRVVGVLKRVLLLTTVCMFGVVTMAGPAAAEHTAEHVREGHDGSSTPATASPGAQDPCPDPNFPRETPDGCQASNLPDVSMGMASSSATATPTATAMPAATPPASTVDTVPLNPDGTCPEGYVTVNAPFCAQESPNTPGRIFGYGEGDLATASPAASSASPGTAAATSSATATPEAVAPKATPSEASPATKAKPAKDDVTKTKPAKDDTIKAKPAKPHLSEPSEATEAGQGQPDKAAVDEKKLPDTSGPVASLAWVPLVVLLGIGGLLGIWTWLMNRREA